MALHGMMGGPDDWDSHGLGVEAVDLFGEDPAQMADWGEQFSRHAKANEGKRVILGYSLGGRLALHALLADPECWSAAIIVSAHPGLRHDTEREARLRADEAWATKLREMEWRAFLEEWNSQPVFAGAEWAGPKMPSATRRERMGMAFDRWSLGRQEDLRAHFGRIGFPILWLTGAKDPKFCALAREAVSGLRLGQHAVVEDAGHRAPWEQPGRFQSIVLAFLRECGIE